MQKTGKNITLKYNVQGIRTEKTANGVMTQYYLVGDKVTYETDGGAGSKASSLYARGF